MKVQNIYIYRYIYIYILPITCCVKGFQKILSLSSPFLSMSLSLYWVNENMANLCIYTLKEKRREETREYLGCKMFQLPFFRSYTKLVLRERERERVLLYEGCTLVPFSRRKLCCLRYSL